MTRDIARKTSAHAKSIEIAPRTQRRQRAKKLTSRADAIHGTLLALGEGDAWSGGATERTPKGASEEGTTRSAAKRPESRSDDGESGEKYDVERKPLRRTPRRRLDWELVRAYGQRLGVVGVREWGASGWGYASGWTVTLEQLDPVPAIHLVLSLLEGRYRFAPRALTTTRWIAFDVDVHADPPRPRRTIDAFIKATRSLEERRRMRTWRAERAMPVVARLRELGTKPFLVATRRGYHAVALLDTDVPVRRAHEAAAAIARLLVLPKGVGLDVFPTAPRERGPEMVADMCSLPLGGPARAIADDLVTMKGTRAEGLRALLGHPAQSIEELERIGHVERARKPPLLSEEEAQATLDAMLGRSRPRRNPGSGPASAGHLAGIPWAQCVLRYLICIEEGEHWEAVRKLTAAARYCGLSDNETKKALGHHFAQPHHTARCCQSRAGQSQMMAEVRAQLRHFRRGVKAGQCEAGRMRRYPQIRARFVELLASAQAA